MCNVQRPKSEHRMHKKKLNNKKKHTHTNVHTESNEILNTKKKKNITHKNKKHVTKIENSTTKTHMHRIAVKMKMQKFERKYWMRKCMHCTNLICFSAVFCETRKRERALAHPKLPCHSTSNFTKSNETNTHCRRRRGRQRQRRRRMNDTTTDWTESYAMQCYTMHGSMYRMYMPLVYRGESSWFESKMHMMHFDCYICVAILLHILYRKIQTKWNEPHTHTHVGIFVK